MIITLGADLWFCLCGVDASFLVFFCYLWVIALGCLIVNASESPPSVAIGGSCQNVFLGIGSWHLGMEVGLMGPTGGRKAGFASNICLVLWKWRQRGRRGSIQQCATDLGMRLGNLMEKRIGSKEQMIVQLLSWLALLYTLIFKINIPIFQVQPSITRLNSEPPTNLVPQDTPLLYFLCSRNDLLTPTDLQRNRCLLCPKL